MEYNLLFQNSPDLYLILDENLIILDATNKYLSETMTVRENIINKYIFTVFPDNPDETEATGVTNLYKSLQFVLTNKKPHQMAVQKYDVKDAQGIFVERYWYPINSPVIVDNKVKYIIHKVENVTQVVKLNEQLQRKNVELMKARDDAMESMHLKSAFIANISHELRTPLTAIIGFTELLNTTLLSHEQENMKNLIADSAQTLLSMVNDILDMSKIEAGKLQIFFEPISITELVSKLIQTLSVQTKNKGITLSSNIDIRIPKFVKGDKIRISQILLNLLSNAIKFTEKGGIIVNIQLEKETENMVFIRFEVIDTGIGISKESQEKLFTPFFQADINTTRRYGGTGLGLTISKRLVDLMNGTIGVESQLGIGSKFWFQIPFETNIIQTIQVKISQQTLPKDKIILLVEDNSILQLLIQTQLKNLDIDFYEARNGVEAVKKYTKFELVLDLILMDIQMPEMNGYTATRLIRELEKEKKTRRLPIIAMTASVMQEDKDQCYESGMDDILFKPFTIDELKSTLAKWLRS